MTNPNLIIVDGSYYMYRAYYASMQQNLTSPDGFPTGMLKFMTNMLHGALTQYACPVIVALDSKSKNFRHELYDQYKANRDDTPDDLMKQYKPMCNIMRALGLILIKKRGWEADDLIGTLAKQATEESAQVIILTGDKDLKQFVNKHVSLYDSLREKTVTFKSMMEEDGLHPKQVPAYLALCGDTADNIPGVQGIGPKTATALLSKYKNLKTIYKHLDELPKGQQTNLKKGKDTLKLSLSLTKCNTEVPLGFHVESVLRKPRAKLNKAELTKIFNQFNMKFMWMR